MDLINAIFTLDFAALQVMAQANPVAALGGAAAVALAAAKPLSRFVG